MSNQNLVNEILKYVGGIENVEASMNCLTRLRLTLIDSSKADNDKIKKLDGVIGVVVEADSFQIVVGPSKSKKLGAEVEKILNEYKEECAELSKPYGANVSGTAIKTKISSNSAGKAKDKDIDAQIAANKKK